MTKVARILLGLLFVLASLEKILDPVTFARAVANYHLVPWSWVGLAALLVPWLELTAGLALALGCLARSAALLLGLLAVTFAVAQGAALARGLDINCGCFQGAHPVSIWTLGLDLLVAVVASWLVVRRP